MVRNKDDLDDTLNKDKNFKLSFLKLFKYALFRMVWDLLYSSNYFDNLSKNIAILSK